MRLIALETATESCSAALWSDGEVLWQEERVAARRHGELLLQQVDRLLAEGGMHPSQLDAIAVGRGPGAFTGVRLGLGVAQGLAFSLERPVVPVSTLAVLAQQAAWRWEGRFHDLAALEILALLDARMGEVYWGIFRLGAGGLVQEAQEQLDPLVGLRLSWHGASRVALGSGLNLEPPAQWSQWGLAQEHCAPDALPHAREVALLGAEGYRQGRAVAAERAQPMYLRNAVATPKATHAVA